MAAVAAAERQRTISKSGERGDRTPADRNDLGRPGEVGVAHGDRAAAMATPRVGLQIREAPIPCDGDAWRGISPRGQKGPYLGLITLGHHHFDAHTRLLE